MILNIIYLVYIYPSNFQEWDKYLFEYENWWYLEEKKDQFNIKKLRKTSYVLESDLKYKKETHLRKRG